MLFFRLLLTYKVYEFKLFEGQAVSVEIFFLTALFNLLINNKHLIIKPLKLNYVKY
jgi:hypothetical protein